MLLRQENGTYVQVNSPRPSEKIKENCNICRVIVSRPRKVKLTVGTKEAKIHSSPESGYDVHR